MLISDIDNTLIGDSEGLKKLMDMLERASDYTGFGVATGRSLELTMDVLKEWHIPIPDLLITSVGTEIYYGPEIKKDEQWERYIDFRWKPETIREALRYIPGLILQPPEGQRKYKISYIVDIDRAPDIEEIKAHLRKLNLSVNVVFSHQEFLDILPIRASKGKAIRYISGRWNIPINRILVAGDSGNDEEMLLLDGVLGVVVGNHSPEIERLRGKNNIYFAKAWYAKGIIEAI
ncbi:MAG: HAD-IIB family hydrolase, partial [Nitrospirae bacterium]